MQKSIIQQVHELKASGLSKAEVIKKFEGIATAKTVDNYWYTKPKPARKTKKPASKAKKLVTRDDIDAPTQNKSQEHEILRLRQKLAATRTIMRGLIEYSGLSHD